MPAQEDFLPRFALHALPALKGSFRSPLRNLGGNHNVRQVARRVRHLHVRDSPYCPKVLAIRSLYVMLDIRDHGSDGGQTAGLAERQGENAPFQCRGSGRGRIPAAQIAERRESWSAAFAANAVDWLAMPRTPDQRREPNLADCLPRCYRRRGDPRCIQQEDCCDAKRSFDELQKTPCSLLQSSVRRRKEAKMNTLKKARLQQHGWAVGETAEFLNLTPQEAQFVELKLALAAGVRQLREQRGMTQAALAEQLGSSQSRIAKMEAADRSVTVDLMMRSLLAIGATPGEIAKLIKRVETHRAA